MSKLSLKKNIKKMNNISFKIKKKYKTLKKVGGMRRVPLPPSRQT